MTGITGLDHYLVIADQALMFLKLHFARQQCKTMRSSLHLLQLVRGYNERGVYILNGEGCVIDSNRKHQL